MVKQLNIKFDFSELVFWISLCNEHCMFNCWLFFFQVLLPHVIFQCFDVFIFLITKLKEKKWNEKLMKNEQNFNLAWDVWCIMRSLMISKILSVLENLSAMAFTKLSFEMTLQCVSINLKLNLLHSMQSWRQIFYLFSPSWRLKLSLHFPQLYCLIFRTAFFLGVEAPCFFSLW